MFTLLEDLTIAGLELTFSFVQMTDKSAFDLLTITVPGVEA